MARTRRRDWIRHQGRANAALMLLARDMGAEFVEPGGEQEFAEVRGRAAGCTFELRVRDAAKGGPPALRLVVRHFHSQHAETLDGEGCTLPALDPAAVRAAVEDECRRFAAASE